eukprot:1204396-Rhodomonas_salina.1
MCAYASCTMLRGPTVSPARTESVLCYAVLLHVFPVLNKYRATQGDTVHDTERGTVGGTLDFSGIDNVSIPIETTLCARSKGTCVNPLLVTWRLQSLSTNLKQKEKKRNDNRRASGRMTGAAPCTSVCQIMQISICVLNHASFLCPSAQHSTRRVLDAAESSGQPAAVTLGVEWAASGCDPWPIIAVSRVRELLTR